MTVSQEDKREIRHRGGGHVKTEAETKGMWPQARGLPGLGTACGGNVALPTPRFWASRLWDLERKGSVALSYMLVVLCYSDHRKLIQMTSIEL